MYISLYVVVNTFIGGRQPQNKLMRLRTFKKNMWVTRQFQVVMRIFYSEKHVALAFLQPLFNRGSAVQPRRLRVELG